MWPLHVQSGTEPDQVFDTLTWGFDVKYTCEGIASSGG